LNFEGGELVDDLLIVLQGIMKMLKYFFPIVLFTIIGLAYIYQDEKRDKVARR